MEYRTCATSLFDKRYQVFYTVVREDGRFNKRVKSVFLIKSGMEFELREVLEKKYKYLNNVKEVIDREYNSQTTF